tara:strand:+ start:730 stop:1092 length:363 start_codon:yes stop_codon:yes gene_type:complete
MELTPEFAKRCREDAHKKYMAEKAKLGTQMMTMSYFKIKSLLTEEGLKKVGVIDQKRQSNGDYNEDFSERLWSSTEKAWEQIMEILILNISNAYELKKGQDIITNFLENNQKDNKLDFYS